MKEYWQVESVLWDVYFGMKPTEVIPSLAGSHVYDRRIRLLITVRDLRQDINFLY